MSFTDFETGTDCNLGIFILLVVIIIAVLVGAAVMWPAATQLYAAMTNIL